MNRSRWTLGAGATAQKPDTRRRKDRTNVSVMDRHLGSLVGIIWVILHVGCASSGGISPEPFPRVSSARAVDSGSPTAGRYAVTHTALSLTGTPYRSGGNTPRGFDCSGFTRYVFGQHGIALPRRAQDQFEVGDRIDPADLQPGDLVFFTTVAPGASHVGVAIDGDEFVHAPSERGEVRIERLSDRYWSARYLGARRVVK